MRGNNSDRLLRLGLIFVGLLVIVLGGIYVLLTFTIFESVQEIVKPVLETPAVNIPTRTPTPTEELQIVATTAVPTNSPTVTATAVKPTSTPTPNVPAGGIVYALSPDVNSVGWVQSGEKGNHFGESFLYTGLRDGALSHGAMQFNLAFIPNGSTIFLAELELTGLTDAGLTADSAFEVNILAEDIDANWSRHNFEAIHNAVVDETLTPLLKKSELSPENVNKFVFNAAQRSIIEQRLESNLLSFRLDSLTPDQEGWFAWDSGYGEQSQGRGPILRLGVLPPVATEVAETEAEAEVFSTPTSTPTFVVVTSTPTPENLQTAAAIALVATAQATTTGTSTPIPANWVTPVVVTETPTPGNAATAQFQQAEATAAVIVFGTLPPNIVVATPTPTATASPIFIPLEGELPPTTPVPLPTLNVQFTPAELIGKIAFKSDRTGREEYYVINPDGSGLALLTNCWAYNLAEQADFYSADGRFRVFTKDFARYRKIEPVGGGPELNVREDVPAIFWYDAFYKQEQQLTQFGAGIAYGGVWSPTSEQIAFVSNDSQNDEIWVVNRDGSNLLQLTNDQSAFWDKHPSWSPDGTHIAFWSNRTGHGQIFVMNSDGSNLYSLSRTGFNDYDPVWIKYPGIPSFNPDSETGKPDYIGSFGFCAGNGDLNCSAFTTQPQAQTVFNAAGGPQLDPYGLDEDRNGKACENLPEVAP